MPAHHVGVGTDEDGEVQRFVVLQYRRRDGLAGRQVGLDDRDLDERGRQQ
jgi:hypothetical protein